MHQMKKMSTRRNTLLFAFSCLLVFSACKKEGVTDVPAPPPPPAPPAAPGITMNLKAVRESVGNSSEGYYVGLPSNYDQTTDKYPILIYIPGAGQFGNGAVDLPLLLKDGPIQLVDEKKFPGTFTVGGKTFSMIVFTPQLKWYPSTFSIDGIVEYVKQKFRVDTNRIYLSGLSMGGSLTCDLGGEKPNKLAAIVPMAGVSIDYATSNKCQMIAANNLPVWAFHSNDDQQFAVSKVNEFIAKVNSFNPPVKAKVTVWPNGGHDSWTRALNPAYKENGMNMYEWMLQYHR